MTLRSAAACRRALILAAGRGARMRPLTDTCPKPLLPVRGKPLIGWWADALTRDGITEIVINTAWLGMQVEAHFKQRSAAPGPRIFFSSEGQDFGHALETAGGIARVLPRLAPRANDVFWVVAGDAHAPGFAFSAAQEGAFAASTALAHLWLVPNPPHHPQGDFALDGGRVVATNAGAPRHTFSGIALYRRELFLAPWCAIPPGNPRGAVAPLAPLLRRAIAGGLVTGTLYAGAWTDVGTPERWTQLNDTPD